MLNVPRPWLLPFSPLYGLITDLRNFAYEKGFKKSYTADIPVISVGNLSTGGTGKTPVAEWLLDFLLKNGKKAAYLSRGYGRQTKGFRWVDREQGRVQEFGDEALQVARKFPQAVVAVCEDRKTGIRELVEEKSVELIVLDDAFQHRKVKRDLDWVVIDAHRLPTHDALLPAGNLRERRKHLRRADLLIINRVSDPADIPRIRQELEPFGRPMAFLQPGFQGVVDFQSGEKQPLESLKNSPVILFTGIGNPQAFSRQVAQLGATIQAERFFSDHHLFSEKDLRQLRSLVQQYPDSRLLTTEKDATRLLGQPWMQEFADLSIAYLPLELNWLEGEELVVEQLAELS